VDGATQAAGGLSIAGKLLQPHRFVIQRLDKLTRALEKELAELAHPVIGRDGHTFASSR
jgi:hypothetical protein